MVITYTPPTSGSYTFTIDSDYDIFKVYFGAIEKERGLHKSDDLA